MENTSEKATERHGRVKLPNDPQDFGCGSEGFIAYRDGKPWSVNVDRESCVQDWRYELESHRGCPECARLRAKTH